MRLPAAGRRSIATTTTSSSSCRRGEATITAGDRELVVGAGDIVVVPAGQPHCFVNSGSGPLRQIDVHLSPRYVTEWLP